MQLSSITHPVINSSLIDTVNKANGQTSTSSHFQKNLTGGEDTVIISQEGKDKAYLSKSFTVAHPSAIDQSSEILDQQQLLQLQKLKRRDQEVRTHEQAHLSAAGQYAQGGATFTYQKGPDGGSYAIGGEVGIDVAKESSPQATITKMQAIKRAALAPANPSGADKRIAAQANAKESQARQELLNTQQENLLRGESASNLPPEGKEARQVHKSELVASSYSSLKTKLASYVQMSEN